MKVEHIFRPKLTHAQLLHKVYVGGDEGQEPLIR
jgi:hypothetical protein